MHEALASYPLLHTALIIVLIGTISYLMILGNGLRGLGSVLKELILSIFFLCVLFYVALFGLVILFGSLCRLLVEFMIDLLGECVSFFVLLFLSGREGYRALFCKKVYPAAGQILFLRCQLFKTRVSYTLSRYVSNCVRKAATCLLPSTKGKSND